MNAARLLLALVVLFVASLTVSQVSLRGKPKAGIYMLEDKPGSKIVLTPAPGGNFTVSGTLGAGSKISGTLFTRTGRLAANVLYHPYGNKSKTLEGPLDGYWSQDRITITLFDKAKVDWDAVSITKRAGNKVGDKAGHGRDNDLSKKVPKVASFTGRWDTSFGKMTLTQGGKSVTGTYDYYSGTINGEIKADGNMYFTWTQSNPDKKGTGFFKLSSDGNSFSGSWDYTMSNGQPANNGGGWSGTRIK